MTNEPKTPAAQPASDELSESVIDAVAEALGDAYDCGRVWSAWSYGTMGPDDFSLIAEDTDRVAEIARAAIDADRAMRAQPAPAAVAIPDGHLYAALNDLLTHIGMEGVVTADHPFVLDTMAALKRIDGGVYLDNLAIPTEPDAYRADMLATVILLEDGEWTEHHAKTPLGMRLEDAITKLHNELHAASASGGAAPAAVVVTSDEDEALDLLAHLFDAWENGPQCYEDPDEQSGYIGQAFRLDNTVFHRCADLLNRRRPHQEKSITAPQPPVEAQEPGYQSTQLAEMILSDCGCSSNFAPLLDRVARRIEAHVEQRLSALRACIDPAPQQAAQGGARALIRSLLTLIERNTCEHDETYRGGAIWEICSTCGKKWADDEGGKPAVFEWPAEVEAAREYLLASRAQAKEGGK